MKLIDAIPINSSSRIAIVGAGGKTSLLFSLANAYQNQSILSTTTHISQVQADLADEHTFLTIPVELLPYVGGFENKTTIFTGKTDDGRLGGVEIPLINKLHELATLHQHPMLIEADGARNLWFKAPESHEPLIPTFINHVIICVNLKILGQSLNGSMVHRNEIISKILNIPDNSIIDEKIIANLITNPKGGLKNIPNSAKIIVFLNHDFSNEKNESVSLLVKLILKNEMIDEVIAGNISYREALEDNVEKFEA